MSKSQASEPDLTIDHQIMIEAPIDVVWRTITTPDQIAQWFADVPDLDLRPGGNGTLVIHTHEGSDVVAPVVVDTVDPPREFAFRWAHPDGEDPVPGRSVLVTFTLEEHGHDRTQLRVVETGVDTIHWTDADKANFAAGHNEGWPDFLNHLAGLYAGGSADGATGGQRSGSTGGASA